MYTARTDYLTFPWETRRSFHITIRLSFVRREIPNTRESSVKETVGRNPTESVKHPLMRISVERWTCRSWSLVTLKEKKRKKGEKKELKKKRKKQEINRICFVEVLNKRYLSRSTQLKRGTFVYVERTTSNRSSSIPSSGSLCTSSFSCRTKDREVKRQTAGGNN